MLSQPNIPSTHPDGVHMRYYTPVVPWHKKEKFFHKGIYFPHLVRSLLVKGYGIVLVHKKM